MPKKEKKTRGRLPRCPYCGAPMEIRPGAEIYRSGGSGEQLLVCRNYPECDAYIRLQRGTGRWARRPTGGSGICAGAPTGVSMFCGNRGT